LADEAELAALVAACDDRIWQINVTAKFDTDATTLTNEVDRWARLGRPGRTRMTWSPLFSQSGSDTWKRALEHMHMLRSEGVTSVPQVSTQLVSTAFSFADAPPVLFRVTGWGAPLRGFDSMTRAERAAALRDTALRHGLREAGTNGVGMLAPRFGAWTIAASPTHPELAGQTVASLGSDAVGALLDLALEDELETVVQIPLINDDEEGLVGLVTDEGTLIALGDAGAHVNSVTGFAYTTRVLTDMVRDGGHLTLEQAVHRLTEQPARLFGITERGTLQPGQAADVCVIDLDGLALQPPEIRRDLPEGASRLYQGARGYRAVFVNGTRVIEGDARLASPGGPGRVLRI
jgi:N-acyl-D-aspartate/D-glutamate deacylase